MRKLTGYIGAIIIVFALMGSILLGYALNINGTTATVNAYDPVTDVSGLYTHSQEPAYIDYNPASNYISYQTGYNETYTNPTATNTYKKLNSGDVVNVNISDRHVSINGVDGGTPTGTANLFALFSNKFYIYFENGITPTLYDYWSTIVISNNFSVTYTNTTISLHISGGATYTYTDVGLIVAYSSVNPDYYISSVNGSVNDYYLTNENQVLFLTTPAFRILYNGDWIGVSGQSGTDGTADVFVNGTVINEYVTKYTLGGTVNGVSLWNMAYPMEIKLNTDIGINYTESNRVNNYPIETDYSTTTGTSTASLDLMAMSASNQAVGTWVLDQSGGFYNSGSVAAYWMADNFKSYTLSDIIATLSPPANTKTIRFQYDTQYFPWGSTYYDVNGSASNRVTLYYDVPYNAVCLMQKNWTNANGTNKVIQWISGYTDYNIDTGICDCYDSYGSKYLTSTPSDLCISFIPNTATTSTAKLYITGEYTYEDSLTYSLGTRQKPTVNIIYTTTGNITNVHYADITKGYSIKDTNVENTVWNNEYNNGNIQLLFRSETTPGYYHNDIIIGDNDISIDYQNNKYFITLNSGEPVDIGMWRNIVLDIDLINGKLSAIPVKTFNSYTNVELMNTIIPVGDLVNPAPTNIIEWAPTTNSLMFNVYSTRVNMDTFGVVMVDPSLNIQDYFTNLNNFYRMNFYNFSTYGNSITINGQTSTVTNGTVTYEGETLRLKDLNVTYADGHTYIGDSNIEVDLGATSDYTISMTGAWYFQTMLEEGYTQLKTIYEWDWGAFILDNTQFCIIYMGLALVGLVIARRFCNLSIIDYSVLVVSAIIAFTVQVVA